MNRPYLLTAYRIDGTKFQKDFQTLEDAHYEARGLDKLKFTGYDIVETSKGRVIMVIKTMHW